MTARSFEDLFREFYKPVEGFFAQRGFSREECQDLAQETFLRAHKGFDRFRHESKTSTWLFTIAANLWRNQIREASAAKRDGDEVSLAEGELGEPTAEALAHDVVLGKEKLRFVSRAVEKLPHKMRRCFLYRVYQGREYGDIAALLEISEATVKSQVSLARSRLRERMADRYPE